MKSRLVFFTLLFLSAENVMSRDGELALHLFAAACLPNGEFGADEDTYTRVTRISGFEIGDKIGLGQTGFGIGAELIAPVWVQGLEWVLSSRILVNGINSDAIMTEYRSQFIADTVTVDREKKAVEDIFLDFGQWIHIPTMTGLQYKYHFSHIYTVYGILQAGVNLSRAPSKKATVRLATIEGFKESVTAEDTEYEFVRDYGFEIGAGFVLNQTYNLGFRYLNLNTPRYQGVRRLSEEVFPDISSREDDIIGEERSVSMFLITLGIQLFR